ncbi:hypothetical protein FQA39_LY14492 [Lamprigera yunnana]|nr:hypothetical protein FQA39_LY14492 [Lamprigera yunnana]
MDVNKTKLTSKQRCRVYKKKGLKRNAKPEVKIVKHFEAKPQPIATSCQLPYLNVASDDDGSHTMPDSAFLNLPTNDFQTAKRTKIKVARASSNTSPMDAYHLIGQQTKTSILREKFNTANKLATQRKKMPRFKKSDNTAFTQRHNTDISSSAVSNQIAPDSYVEGLREEIDQFNRNQTSLKNAVSQLKNEILDFRASLKTRNEENLTENSQTLRLNTIAYCYEAKNVNNPPLHNFQENSEHNETISDNSKTIYFDPLVEQFPREFFEINFEQIGKQSELVNSKKGAVASLAISVPLINDVDENVKQNTTDDVQLPTSNFNYVESQEQGFPSSDSSELHPLKKFRSGANTTVLNFMQLAIHALLALAE